MDLLGFKRTGLGLVSAAVLCGGLLAAQPVFAKTTLKANSQWPEAHSGSQVDKWWAEEIEKRTDGEVEVRLFFSGALGKAGENLELMRSGAIEIAMMSPGYFPAQLPMHAAPNSIPMAMESVGQATELMERLMDEVPALNEEAEENGLKTLFFHHLNPYLLVCKEPVTDVLGMAGKKFRTWGEALPKAAEAVGATPVTLFLPEVYEGLSRGTVDCIPFSVDLIVNYKIYEVAKHVSEITIWEGPTNATWISLDAWNELSPEHQVIIEEVSREAMRKDRDATLAADAGARATLAELGVTFHEFPEEERQKWRDANPDFFADFIATMDEKGKGDAARKMISIWGEVVP
ncbi:2,3-diketo-L-gulonate-binding periplasmic protein YiaO precursor [Roseovarius albus]|uniref:2,3-diketo-L-gulonate-binding periplasmic protein YiaO n=1 Tax=Roseovarius albus TaxID=1247867 RepID=A0A1X7AA70_9RHOB|nr:C4-dicarboxylate TRAP transporter substrate-binding protein [Roseovarius albus]SLN73786.1 2,3-diketo-L-gulonate-binding periplasmic protein YiaO precursor [Roseovarius albus]